MGALGRARFGCGGVVQLQRVVELRDFRRRWYDDRRRRSVLSNCRRPAYLEVHSYAAHPRGHPGATSTVQISRLVRERILERILVEPAAPSCRSPAVAAPRGAMRAPIIQRASSIARDRPERSVPSRTAPAPAGRARRARRSYKSGIIMRFEEPTCPGRRAIAIHVRAVC